MAAGYQGSIVRRKVELTLVIAMIGSLILILGATIESNILVLAGALILAASPLISYLLVLKIFLRRG